MIYGIHHQLHHLNPNHRPLAIIHIYIFLGTTGYSNDGVNLDVGTSTTVFIFKVKYQSPDSVAPDAATQN